jgi:ABC-type multidrug transport system ATPase subunit/pSer/pThr/pTyr-binding forkhead associated (FHA) protein/ABC-type transport system involved in multi-copper enzyme maturation permease subunit
MKNKWVSGRKWHGSKYKKLPSWARVRTISLEVYSGDRRYRYTLDKGVSFIGFENDNTIVLNNDYHVDTHHAKIERVNKVLFITDLTTRYGTQVNGRKIKSNQRVELSNYDVITIGSATLKVITEDEGPACITIGRSKNSGITLDHPAVSREHARMLRQGTQHVLEDLRSTSGTFVKREGERTSQRIDKPHVIKNGDVINIGPYELIYQHGKLQIVDEPLCLGIDAYQLQKKVPYKDNNGKKTSRNLLQDISLSIQPGEFIAIVGPHGCGKSTLLKGLNKFQPVTSGTVLINGNDLYSNYDMYRNQFGYASQKNIIHMGLKVREVLNYSAKLRLQADTTREERDKRIKEVMETLKITGLEKQYVSTLSGGELKKVILGVELLAKPGILFLDEITTGLDPYWELKVMQTLKDLSEGEHTTILLVTHATENITKCHKVVFLTKEGYLAFYGKPGEALKYFGVEHFSEIYKEVIEKELPKMWGDKFKYSEGYRNYIKDRQDQFETLKQASSAKTASSVVAKQKHVSSWSQLLTLSQRNLGIIKNDRLSLILMLMMAPLIGLLDFIFWKPGIFDANGGDPMRVIMSLYMAAIVCFLVGGLASMREIVKEWDIYERERMVCLNILPYVLSKLLVAILFSLYSAGVFTLFMRLAGHWPPIEQVLAIYITMALSILAGMVTGLLISSFTRNQNVTPLILLLFLVPQVIFGGVMPEEYSGKVGQVIGALTTTKWTFQSLVTVSDMGECVGDDQCRAEECSGPNMFTECNFPGVASYYNADDEASAIMTANKSISSIEEQWGNAFNVNVKYHWCILLSFIAGLFGLVLVVLKRKDSK